MRRHTLLFILYVLFAAYFINIALGIIAIPDFFSNFNKWISFIGGILLLIGGIQFLRPRRRYL